MPLIRKHYWAIILALGVGFLFLLLQISFQLALGSDFKGIFRTINDDEQYYMARAREIVDGHFLLSNPYYLEHKNGQPMQFFLPDFLFGFPAIMLNIDIYVLFEVYDFILPAIIFLLVYCIFFLLIKNQFWSIFASCWMMLVQYFMYFNRPVSPQFIFPFALTLVIFLISILNSRKRRIFIILAGINFGLLFHIYYYYWTYFSVLLVLLISYYFWRKDFEHAKIFLSVFILGIIIGLPYFYQSWQALQLEVFAESMLRLGMLDTRFPSGIQIVIPALVLVVLYLFYFKKKLNHFAFFLLAGLLSALIAVNQHLITGKNLLFSSHYEPISYFFIAFAFVYMFAQSKHAIKFLRSKMVKIIFSAILIIRFFPIFSEGLQFDQGKIEAQKYAPVLSWLNNNTAKDSVVMASGGVNALIPTYTHNNVLFHENAGLHFISNDEILDRFVTNNFWKKDLGSNYVKDNLFVFYNTQLKAKRGKAAQKNKVNKFLGREIEDLNAISYPPEKIQRVLDSIASFDKERWIKSIDKYKVDYLVVDISKQDQREKYYNEIKNPELFRVLYSENNIKIFALN